MLSEIIDLVKSLPVKSCFSKSIKIFTPTHLTTCSGTEQATLFSFFHLNN